MDDWSIILLVALFAVPITICLLMGLVERIKNQAPSTQALNQELENKIKEYESLKESLHQQHNQEIERISEESKKDYKKKVKELAILQYQAKETQSMYESMIEDFEIYIQEKCDLYPHLAAIMADLLTLHYEKAADYLDHKQNPAHAEAYRIRELRRETKEILAQKKGNRI